VALRQRIVEPELMDEGDQATAYAEADFEAPHNTWVRQALAFLSKPRGLCLDIGCGPADVVVRLAVAAPELVIDGIDGAEAMLALGRQRVGRHDLHNRVRLYRCVLPTDPLPRTAYDIVTSNSILHHLHQPQGLWRTLWKASRPGTEVFIVDLMRPATTEMADAMVATHAGSEPAILQRDFHASLCAAFTVAEVRDQLDGCGLGYLDVEATSDRHLVVHGVMR
jgi:ubiquinone/menaquinone biosynthesis C-methylase UbiE